jgi:quercetin dioxygenase-like cupin family protein
MRRIAFSLVAGVALAAVVTSMVLPVDTPTAGSTPGAPLRETVTVAADVPIPNLPGKRLVSHVVDYPPGASSAPHRHARSAFIYAYVLSGEIRSQVDGEPARVYRPGETWFESPGAHHRVSANASDTEPARLLAVLIVDAADEQLVIPDPQ